MVEQLEQAVVPKPYPPSWLDRLTAWVDRLPGPYWAYYFGLVLPILVWIAQRVLSRVEL